MTKRKPYLPEEWRERALRTKPYGTVRKWSDKEIERLLQMRELGYSYLTIANHLGRSESAVGMRLTNLRRKGLIE
jgi:hypothetical protein